MTVDINSDLFGDDIESAEAMIAENEARANQQKEFAARAITGVPEGEGITVRFVNNPSKDHWLKVFEKWEPTAGKRGLLLPCAANDVNSQGKYPSKRYLVHAVDTRENKAVVLKLSKTLFDSLLRKYNSKGTLTDRDYTLTRYGTGQDTEYEAEAERENERDLSRFDDASFPDLKEVWQKHANEMNSLDSTEPEVPTTGKKKLAD